MSVDDAYFVRQLVLEGFGRRSQQRLATSRVLVAGLGGTGGLMAVELALAGVGHLTLVDRDVVSFENLHRQPVYSVSDVGKSKAEVAARFLKERVPHLEVSYRTESLDYGNSLELLGDADLAVDCLDSMEGRRALNFACAERNAPLVHTGANGWEVSEAVFWPGRTACFECTFPRVANDRGQSKEDLPSCEQVGTLGPIVGMATSLGATDAIKVLAGLNPLPLGRMNVWDGRFGEFHQVDLKRREECPACGKSRRPLASSNKNEIAKGRVIELCGGKEYYITNAIEPRSFVEVGERLVSEGAEMKGESIVSVQLGAEEVSLFRSGGALVRGVHSAGQAAKVIAELGLRAEVEFATGNA